MLISNTVLPTAAVKQCYVVFNAHGMIRSFHDQPAGTVFKLDTRVKETFAFICCTHVVTFTEAAVVNDSATYCSIYKERIAQETTLADINFRREREWCWYQYIVAQYRQ